MQALESRAVLNSTNRELGQSQLRLSTALRVNRAEDDAASFSIAAKVSARIAGLEQALQNAGDAKSVLAIAEQNLYKIQDLLNEVKAKITQGASSLDGTIERTFVRDQINGYAAEINSIIEGAVYNGVNILDGSYEANFQVGEKTSETLSLTLEQDITVQDLQVYEVSTFARLSTDGTATAASSINAFNEWQSVQAGDTFDIILTQGDGTQLAPITITAAGNKGELTTTTIGDIVAAINGTGSFDAVFNTDRQSIDVVETVAIEGNGLAVQITNYVEFPGTDGAIANFSFGFDNATGNLVSNFTSAGAINAGTALNNLDQFSELEGQDEIRITLRPRSGASEDIIITLPGASATPSNFTVGNLRDAINAQSVKFNAVVDGAGQIVLTEQDLDQINLNASSGPLIPEDLDIGNASVSNVNFANSASSAQISGVNAGTLIEGSMLGSDFRDGDEFNIQLTRNDGSVGASITYTIQGGDTFGDIRQAILDNSDFEAEFDGGNLVIREADFQAGNSLALSLNAFSAAPVTFNDTAFDVAGNELSYDDGGATVSGATLIANTGLGSGFAAGDSFQIALSNADGTVLRTISYTFAADDDTFDDLLNEIDSQLALNPGEFSAQIIGGALVITDDTGAIGASLSGDFENFTQNTATFNNTNSTNEEFVLNSANQLSPGFTPATLLNDLDQFTNVQAGDTLAITLTNAVGLDRSFTFTFDGDLAGASTSTVSDLITAITARPDLVASFDANLGQIIVEDVNNQGNQLQFSFSNAGFTEEPRDPVHTAPNPMFSFSYQDEGMTTTGLGAAGMGTNINALAGFEDIRGQDTVNLTLRTRAGTSQTYEFTFAGDAGENTTSTIGDIVNFLDGRTIGSVVFDVNLSGGEIVITESNPPAVGGVGANTAFTEYNIDITPKSFSTFQFNITDLLRLSDDTGLVFGLGLLDFDGGSEFTQQVASIMIGNIDDSIDRIINVINDIANMQTRLSIREETLTNSIISNSAQRSRLQDVDYAKELSRAIQLTLLNRFQSIAMSQANMNPMSVLALL